MLDRELFEQDLQKLRDKVAINPLYPNERNDMNDLLNRLWENYLRVHAQEEKTNKALVEAKKGRRFKVAFEFGIRLLGGK